MSDNFNDVKAALRDSIGRAQGHAFGDYIAWSSLVSFLIRAGTIDGNELLDDIKSSLDTVERLKSENALIGIGTAERLTEYTEMVKLLIADKGGK